jgi:hypothetical protein
LATDSHQFHHPPAYRHNQQSSREARMGRLTNASSFYNLLKTGIAKMELHFVPKFPKVYLSNSITNI